LLIHNLAPGIVCIPRPADYDLIIFVSGHAAAFYLQALQASRPGEAWSPQTTAATVGRASAQVLHDSGVIPRARILHPQTAGQTPDSEGLWAVLQPTLRNIRRVLVVRGETGREWLGERFEAAGAHVERLALYRREPARWGADQQALLRTALAARPCVFLLTSVESVDAIYDNMERMGLVHLWAGSQFVAVHERVASRLQSLLGDRMQFAPPAITLCSPSDDSIFQAALLAASL
jgi:uroporphyrinogen-III synthase